MLNKYFLFQGLGILCSLILVSCTHREVYEPPRGYMSNATMKIAYAIGSLKLIDPSPVVPQDIKKYSDLVYKETEEKNLLVDIYHRDSAQEPTPLLVFIHGGAWKKGEKDDYRKYLVDYAQKGFITATISYRFSSEAPFPAALEDVVCAVKWLKAHALKYHIDPDRIAVIGGSAGGHLAMMLGYHGRDSSFVSTSTCTYDSISPEVKAIVNLYGPVDLTTEYARTTKDVIDFIGVEYSVVNKASYQKASPLHFVSPDDPPTLVFHGTIDDLVPVSQADQLVDALRKENIEVDYHRLKGWPHTMDLGLKVNNYCQYHMDAFFEKHLNWRSQ